MGRRIGIMGGTFNPIHMGHVILAETAYKEYQLDEVMFLPAKKPPHKCEKDLVSQEDRLNMIMATVREKSQFSVSPLEFNREGITYTIDTMEYLQSKHPDTCYYYIIGADSLYNLEKWHRAPELLGRTNFLVAARDGHNYEKMQKFAAYLRKKYHASIQFLNTPMIEISSSMIRERIRHGKSVFSLLPDEVVSYVQQKKLYQRKV